MTKYALEIKHLNKTYRNGVIALKDINLNVEDGDIFAFLGPNGAGKSTVIGIITCLLYTSPSPRDLSTSRMPSSA